MRWFNNPIIAECAIKHERFVAEANTLCDDYLESWSEKHVIQHNSYE